MQKTQLLLTLQTQRKLHVRQRLATRQAQVRQMQVILAEAEVNQLLQTRRLQKVRLQTKKVQEQVRQMQLQPTIQNS